MEAIDSHPRCTQVGIGFCIHRIVGVAQIVNHASVHIDVRTRHEFQLSVDGELVEICQVPVGQEGKFATCTRLVFRMRKVGLEKTLADNEKKLFLNACGYPIEMSVETYINHLKSVDLA